jgi:hypothetical protein
MVVEVGSRSTWLGRVAASARIPKPNESLTRGASPRARRDPQIRGMRSSTLSAILASVVFVALGTAIGAQDAPPPGPAPTPCLTSPERRQFDFWVGEWDVMTPSGGLAGHSSVQVISGGCALLENWTSTRGGHGKSINAYNAATKQWQQYWIGQDGNVTEYRESSWSGKALSFLARTPVAGGSGVSLQRLTFTPMTDGTVRQLGEISADEGKTWKTAYDFRYHRAAPHH